MANTTSIEDVAAASKSASVMAMTNIQHWGQVTTIDSARPGDVQATLMYLENNPMYEKVKPVQIVPEWNDREGKTNVRLTPGPPETIHDVRGRENEFTLDENGFVYVHAPTSCTDWESQPNIAKVYLPELEDLLRREVDGCDEITFYDVRLRQKSEEGTRVQGLSFKPFARQVHTDNTVRSILMKIRNLTDLKADWHLAGRVRLINIWRPIKHAVYDCGLAVADGGKLRPDDVIECDRVRSDTGEFWDTMGVVRHRPGFEWHYMSAQDESDVLLFKNFDSKTDVRARQCLHTAFDLPPDTIPPRALPRESIEVRAMVFTHPEGLRQSYPIPPLRHSIAQALEQEKLVFIDEGPIMTVRRVSPSAIDEMLMRYCKDRCRTDIDEGQEVKDAMLLLYRQQIKRLELSQRALTEENAALHQSLLDHETQLNETSQRLQEMTHQYTSQSMYFQELCNKIADLESKLEDEEARRTPVHLPDLSMVRVDPNKDGKCQETSHNDHALANISGPTTEREVHLLRYIEGQRRELEGWKAEAMGRGNVAVSQCWQAGVDEAVRREREKDSILIVSLNNEIDRLRKLLK